MENFFFFGGVGADASEASRDEGEEKELGIAREFSREESSPVGLFSLYGPD